MSKLIIAILSVLSCTTAVSVASHPPAHTTRQFFNDQTPLATTTIKLTCSAGSVVKINWGDGSSDTVACNGAEQTHNHDYTVQRTYALRLIGNVNKITRLVCSHTFISGDISAVSPLTSLTYLYLGNVPVSGDISAVSPLTSLTYLYLGNTSVSGDISAVSPLTSLTYLYLHSTSVSGDISAVSPLTSLTYLHLGSTSVSGDISAVSPLTSLTYLRLGNTSVSGDISVVSPLTSLTYLHLHSTSVSGDISAVSPLTSLTYLYLYNTSCDQYTSGALPAWPGNNQQIYSIGLDSTEVDSWLIDLADGVGANGTLNIAGTNAARTGASDAAKAALIAAGWSVTVNE